MKQYIPLLALCFLLAGCGPKPQRETIDFNSGWRFALNYEGDASAPEMDDSGWRELNLPHDWSIESDFSEEAPAGPGGGALPGGLGWYRKHFKVPTAWEGHPVRIDFEGVYMNSEVFVNGHSLGVRPNGYVSFGYEIAPYLHYGGAENVIAVKVDNSRQPNSRWYSGSGIYRNVYLTKTSPVHVAHNGTFVRTLSVDAERAAMAVETVIDGWTEGVEVESSILSPEGLSIAVSKASGAFVSQTLDVPEPALWSIENPALYTLVTKVYRKGRLVDEYQTPFGIRTIRFDAAEGFFLNGERLQINGVCMHHDLGCLGAAFNRRAAERQLEILRNMGCNAIRTSHNPPAPALLDLCDRMGFLIMDEAFDVWRKRKTAYDYSLYFSEWHERDLHDFILRDRNHPSVCIWSIGNEVLEQWTDAGADTLTLEQANLLLNFPHLAHRTSDSDAENINTALATKLAETIKALDPSRPVTAGCNGPEKENLVFRSPAIDLIGYNYHNGDIPSVPKNFPGRPFIITESISSVHTRGYYRMPSDHIYKWPARWDLPFHDPSFSCSSYDNCHVPWGNTHEEQMKVIRDYPFISGQFIWTGFDYLGEPTPYGWPARSSYFGIVDLAGMPKDIYYLYQSEWTDRQVLHLFPHWNWKPGQVIDMWCYYNHADEVELFVNGRSQGISRKSPERFHAAWQVAFEPGEVRAVARKEGREVASQVIRTAGEPAAIRLTADRETIHADGKDLSFITVEIIDKDGNLCPWADNLVRFDVSGNAFIAGVDNGCETSLERFKDNKRHAFYGKCLVVLQNDGHTGEALLKAASEGLTSSETMIRSLAPAGRSK